MSRAAASSRIARPEQLVAVVELARGLGEVGRSPVAHHEQADRDLHGQKGERPPVEAAGGDAVGGILGAGAARMFLSSMVPPLVGALALRSG